MKWQFAVGLVLSALFLWLAFRQARLDEILTALASARYALMIPAVVLTIGSFAVRAWRWRFLLAGVRRLPLGQLFSSTMIGFMGNNLLPARLGELLRAHSIGRRTGVSRSAALASVVVERILDIFFLLLAFAAIVVARGLPAELRTWGVALLAVALPIVVLLVLYEARSEAFLGLLERRLPERFRVRVLAVAGNFREGLGVLTRARTLAAAAGASLLMWVALVGVVQLCFTALHLELTLDAALVVLVVMAIGTMIPSAPGYVGTLQYAGTLALLQYGVPRSEALSFTLLYHASQWIPITAVGLACFLREQVGRGRLPGPEPSGEDPGVPIGGEKPATPAGGGGPGPAVPAGESAAAAGDGGTTTREREHRSARRARGDGPAGGTREG